ncbi:MAG: thiamine pyrophosphate-binding protein [Candidatus Rokubacteria bacterium]|nr:thiamine pyrophosphate-binding protein [Candidatus Rokubacteria bacterium]
MPRMTGKRAMVEQLIADGVRHVFGNPGTTEQGFMDILQEYPQLEFMLALHEGVAVSMADAYARLTRRPAFVEVHIAPGLGNALGMMHNAAIGKTPMVVYAGQSPGRTLLQEPHLSGPLVEMAKPICKWSAQIHHAHDVPRALRRAFKVAMEPPQGPVFLALPMDTLDEEADVEIKPTTYTNWRGRVDPAGMADVARLVLAAAKPLMLVGDSVALADAQPELAAFAEVAGVPMFECYASEFNVSAKHPLNLGAVNFVSPGPLKAMLEGCDLLLVMGSPVFQLIFPEAESPIPAGTKLIQIDVNPWEVGKNITPDLSFLADPKAALAELAEQVRRLRTPEQARAAATRAEKTGDKTRAARARYWDQAKASWDAKPISGPRLMHEIRHALPENFLVFSEAITNQPHLHQAIMPTESGRMVRARGGGIGPGLPGSLGAQLARPDRKVVGVCSDGAAMYSISALWTAAHHRIPVTYVMLNNAAYRILKLNMVEYLGTAARGRQFVAMDLTDPDLRFDRMAEAMGVPGRRVERPEELAPALKEALRHDGPSLVDVVMESPVPVP